jgi:hypothetical protein
VKILCVPLLVLLLALGCSGKNDPPPNFHREAAPPQATLISMGSLPYALSDVEGVERTYALFGCDCSFEDVVSHYTEYLVERGYQRSGTAATTRFITTPPADLVELSILSPERYPALSVIPRLLPTEQEQVTKFRTAYVITQTHFPQYEVSPAKSSRLRQ